jgi:iron complex transport system ATP-binding protein
VSDRPRPGQRRAGASLISRVTYGFPVTSPSPAAGYVDDDQIVLSARDVDLVRDGRDLLSGISVAVRAGEHWALLGRNGAGKSTLLRIFATYAHPTRGRVDILGHQLGRVNVFDLRPKIGYVTSHHPLTSARTVREVVLTGATGTIEIAALWQPTAADRARAGELIELLGLDALADRRWPVLSQGERARTLIARALMTRPPLLLLDEPAAGLDIGGREQLLESLAELRGRQPGLATVLVTHHLEELPVSTSHALLLRGARVLAAGPADEVLTTELVSTCFDYPIAIARHAGRWASVARAAG